MRNFYNVRQLCPWEVLGLTKNILHATDWLYFPSKSGKQDWDIKSREMTLATLVRSGPKEIENWHVWGLKTLREKKWQMISVKLWRSSSITSHVWQRMWEYVTNPGREPNDWQVKHHFFRRRGLFKDHNHDYLTPKPCTKRCRSLLLNCPSAKI